MITPQNVGSVVASEPSDGRDKVSNPGAVIRPEIFSRIMSNGCERPCAGYTKIDFTVDEGMEPHNHFRDRKQGRHRRSEEGR